MQEYPETAAYRRGYAACRAELEGRVVAWLEAQDMAFEAMLGACQHLVAWDDSHGDAELISKACSYARAAMAQAKAAKGAKA